MNCCPDADETQRMAARSVTATARVLEDNPPLRLMLQTWPYKQAALSTNKPAFVRRALNVTLLLAIVCVQFPIVVKGTIEYDIVKLSFSTSNGTAGTMRISQGHYNAYRWTFMRTNHLIEHGLGH